LTRGMESVAQLLDLLVEFSSEGNEVFR
jgi:hypothetical protein